MEKYVVLEIDGSLIPLNPFVQRFFKKMVWGMVSALDGIPERPEALSLVIEDDASVNLKLDDDTVRLNAFVQKSFYHVMLGMVRSLKTAPENPQKLSLSIAFNPE